VAPADVDRLVSTRSDLPAGPAPDRQQRGSLEGDAFETLFRECAADVHGYAFSLLGDRQAAEDVTSLAFERLYRFRARLDHARGTPRGWLFTIARNAALDELRKRRSRAHPGAQPIVDEVVHVGDDRAGAALERAERRATVREALARLPRREQEVVLLKFHGQLSNGELARVLGISESNAGTRVHRALTRLRESAAELRRQEVA
jgi:RNA polymerase sigma-70 factor, ECF subfamily